MDVVPGLVHGTACRGTLVTLGKWQPLAKLATVEQPGMVPPRLSKKTIAAESKLRRRGIRVDINRVLQQYVCLFVNAQPCTVQVAFGYVPVVSLLAPNELLLPCTQTAFRRSIPPTRFCAA